MSKRIGWRKANTKVREAHSLQAPSPVRRGPIGLTTSAPEAPAAVTPPNLAPAAGSIGLPAPAAVFRPFWMIGPEPAWCVFGHFNDDTLADRRHESLACQLRLSLAEAHDHGPKLPAERRYDPARLHVKLVQRLTEAEPAVQFHRDRWADEVWFTCTLVEAVDLADRLVTMAALAEEPLPEAPASDGSPFWLSTACPPWCAKTHDTAAHYEDRVHIPDLSEEAMVKVDLCLERATDDEPEWLEVMVERHYRDSISTVALSKSGSVGVSLTPTETRTLADELRRLVSAGQALPLPAAPAPGVTSPERPTPLRFEAGEARYPCPRRISWCDGHSKQEIIDARSQGNMFLHSTVIDRVPAGGELDSYVQVALDYDDNQDRAPYAYLSTDSEGTELGVEGIDRLIIILQRVRTVIVSSDINSNPTGLPTNSTGHTSPATVSNKERDVLSSTLNAA
ncbi:DUF6907 domain-containing protein [Micromonospora sp. NPDC048830]|uniref:DUF6907 domain-containing protein n=1 Tax=Micromonospora sp. NPDC048830 TaxID=3364257 RepID=UPI0037146BFF